MAKVQKLNPLNKLKHLVNISVLLMLVMSFFTHAVPPRNTEDYYLCNNQTGWGGGFGSFAIACDVLPWGQPNFVVDKFTPVIFDHNTPSSNTERSRYMQELYAMLRDSIDYYIAARKPDVTQEEKDAWRLAVFAKAHQETYWTHFRKSVSNNIQMIRGDSGHGHGLVQIDDRWHFSALENGAGWHIFKNITYGMDLFYSEWQNAANASCVSSPTSWIERSRSAYSAYNGGPTKLCRWTDPTDRWAQNDQGYYDKLIAKSWESLVADKTAATTLDIQCFMEEAHGCSAAEGMVEVDSEDPANWPNRQINMESGEACLLHNNTLECVNNSEDLVCLELQFGFVQGQVFPSASATQGYTKNIQEKNQCFNTAVPDLVLTGGAIKTIAKNADGSPKTYDLYTDIGSNSTGTKTVWNKPYQVLDFFISKTSSDTPAYLYYKVKEVYSEGYFLVGALSDLPQTIVNVDVSSLAEPYISIARAGDSIKIFNENGINIYENITEQNQLGHIANNETVTVLATKVTGSDNQIYYQITYSGITGYIYGGKLLNGNTQGNWAGLIPHLAGDKITTKIKVAFKPDGTADDDKSQNVVVPAGTELSVIEGILKFKDKDYELWDYRVRYQNKSGVVFGGFTKEAKKDDVFTDSNALHPDLVGLSRYYPNRMTFTAGNPDQDNDGLPNEWELTYGFDPENAADASIDTDNDGLTNLQEYQQQTDPLNEDTDNDGIKDGEDTTVTPSGTIQFSNTTYSVNENTVSLTLTLTRTDGNIGELSVDVSFTDGTAKNNTDYKAANQTVTFAADDTSKAINIEIVDDSTYTGNINFTANLAVTNGSAATLGANSTATITIVENETKPVEKPPTQPKSDSSGGGGSMPINLILMLLTFVFLRQYFGKHYDKHTIK